MSNTDFFAASVNARRASLQREARAARVARQALRAGRRSAHASRAAERQANAVARDHTPQHARTGASQSASGLDATLVCGS
jgi:hypothetical protein